MTRILLVTAALVACSINLIAQRAAELERYERAIRDWEQARDGAKNELGRARAEAERVRADADLDAKVQAHEDAFREQAESLPGHLKDALTGDDADKAEVAVEVFQNAREEIRARFDLVDAIADQKENLGRLNQLERQIARLEKTIAISETTLRGLRANLAGVQQRVGGWRDAGASDTMSSANAAADRQAERAAAENRQTGRDPGEPGGGTVDPGDRRPEPGTPDRGTGEGRPGEGRTPEPRTPEPRTPEPRDSGREGGPSIPHGLHAGIIAPSTTRCAASQAYATFSPSDAGRRAILTITIRRERPDREAAAIASRCENEARKALAIDEEYRLSVWNGPGRME